jgi:hypothetical protein
MINPELVPLLVYMLTGAVLFFIGNEVVAQTIEESEKPLVISEPVGREPFSKRVYELFKKDSKRWHLLWLGTLLPGVLLLWVGAYEGYLQALANYPETAETVIGYPAILLLIPVGLILFVGSKRRELASMQIGQAEERQSAPSAKIPKARMHFNRTAARRRLAIIIAILVCFSTIILTALPNQLLSIMLVTGIILPFSVCLLASYIFVEILSKQQSSLNGNDVQSE